ncbi:MAG: hypothetical protein IH802_06050, partial [Nitrospinae bacterium]|nr:hypothetical protein [Nitrospinota bacterium]
MHRALEKLPADRFRGAQDFANALANPAFRHGGEGAEAAGTGTTPWNRLSVVSTGLSFVLALALGWTLLVPNDDPEPVTRFVVPAPEGVTAYSKCCGPTVALSPDGQWIVFVGRGVGEGRDPLYRRRLGLLDAEEIPG